MTNSLLDFVMSLVRDSDAATRFAENPEQAIHDANLTDVTTADVHALIPVVSESLSTGLPTTGTDGIIGDTGGNIWTTGEATSAFDAFDDHLPVHTVDDAHAVISDVIDHPGQVAQTGFDALGDTDLPSVVGGDDSAVPFDDSVIHDLPVDDLSAGTGLEHAIADVAHIDPDDSGLDVF